MTGLTRPGALDEMQLFARKDRAESALSSVLPILRTLSRVSGFRAAGLGCK